MLERNRKGSELATENQLASNIHARADVCNVFFLACMHVVFWAAAEANSKRIVLLSPTAIRAKSQIGLHCRLGKIV